MKKILFVASEGVPFIKTGGLADVVGSLPKCIDKRQFQEASDRGSDSIVEQNDRYGERWVLWVCR